MREFQLGLHRGWDGNTGSANPWNYLHVQSMISICVSLAAAELYGDLRIPTELGLTWLGILMSLPFLFSQLCGIPWKTPSLQAAALCENLDVRQGKEMRN